MCTTIADPVRTHCWYVTSTDAEGRQWRWLPWGPEALLEPATDPILEPLAFHPTEESLRAWVEQVLAQRTFKEPTDAFGLEYHRYG